MEFPQAGSGPNRKQIIDALRNTAQSASNMVAENLSVPVDAIAWALRKAGVPVEKPMFGSDWMKEKGVTPTVPEGAAKVIGDTIGMISPMGLTKQGAKAMIDAGSKLKGLPVGLSIKDVSGVYPQAEALALAQQRAALPVEQGGLGLAAGNTPAERAAAMGFDTPAYHGTSADIQAMRIGGNGKTFGAGAFVTDNPAMASTYASSDGGNVIPLMLKDGNYVSVDGKGANWNWLDAKTKMKAPKTNEAKAFSKSVEKVFPDEFRWSDALSTDDIAQWANKQGYEGVNFNAVRDRGPNGVFSTPDAALPSNITAVFNPDQIRSRFAAFDPFRKTAATAAAMGVAAPDLLAQERNK